MLHAQYTEQERISRVKKTYSTLANAMTRVKADGGDMIFDIKDDDTVNIKNWYNKYLKNYLNTTKVCYDTKGCWSSVQTKMLNGRSYSWYRAGIGIGYNVVTAILNDGTYININSDEITGQEAINAGVKSGTDNILIITFDINGDKKPNTIGKDIFVTVFTENGIVPAYKDKTASQISSDCSSSGTGYSCILKYLKQ